MPSLHQGSSGKPENRWSNLSAQLPQWPHYTSPLSSFMIWRKELQITLQKHADD